MAKIGKKLKEQKYNGATTTKRVTITGDPFEQLSWDVIPTYGEAGPNEVIFYRLSNEIGRLTGIHFGEVVDLVYNKSNDEFEARKIHLPAEDWELVLWLFDLPKKWRVNTAEKYREFYDTRLKMLLKDGDAPYWSKEYTIAGGKLAFAQKTANSEPICLAGRILPEFAEEAIREILQSSELRGLLAYEDIAVRAICKDRFGMTQDDFNELRI